MSVPTGDRKPSGMQFLETARELQIYTLRQCLSIPKRYTFFLATQVNEIATQIHQNVKKGNSINPKNRHEVQMRRDYFLRAYAECQNLISQVNIIIEVGQLPVNRMPHWMDLIEEEMNCIKGILTSDEVRYKNLQV